MKYLQKDLDYGLITTIMKKTIKVKCATDEHSIKH